MMHVSLDGGRRLYQYAIAIMIVHPMAVRGGTRFPQLVRLMKILLLKRRKKKRKRRVKMKLLVTPLLQKVSIIIMQGSSRLLLRLDSGNHQHRHHNLPFTHAYKHATQIVVATLPSIWHAVGNHHQP
jgi:hypothetical protein